MKKLFHCMLALALCLCLFAGTAAPASALVSTPRPAELAQQNCYTSGSIGSAESAGICGGVYYAGEVADPIQQTVSYQEGVKNLTEAVTDKVIWTLKDGVLTLSGSGPTAMGLHILFQGNEHIETVVIEEGITNMPGLCYFQNVPNLKTVIFMDAGTYYNQVAYNCPDLKHIIVGTNLKDGIYTGGVTFDFDKTILLSKNVASYSNSEYAQGITVRNDCNVYTHKTTSGIFITNGVISDTSGGYDVAAKNFFKYNTVVPYSQILANAQAALADVPASVRAKLPAELFAEYKEKPVVPVEPVIPDEPVEQTKPTEHVTPEDTTPETMTGTENFTNEETHLRTSHSESNYVDISVSGSTLTVSGRLMVDGLTKVQVKCGSKKETIRVSSGERFSAQLTLSHSGNAAVNVYTYRGTSSGQSIVYNRVYIEKTASGYRIMPSLIQKNNTAFEQSKIDPKAVLAAAEVPATVATMSNSIVGDVTDDYTKVFLLHKWVAENIYYDYDALYGRSERITDSAGVLEARRSVCEGYSRLLKDLILAQGIPAMYCTNLSTDGSYAISTSGGELHAHTEAYVGGRWITMDATWDSNNKYRNGTYTAKAPAGYYYFDISSEAFAMDHKILTRGGEFYVTDDSGFGLSPDGRVLRSYKGSGGVVVIPDGVTEIGEGAFENCGSIISVVIPDSVTTIGACAFYSCENLTSVVLPDSIGSIENNVFSNCSSLKSIVIPEGVTSIGGRAFSSCSSLRSITIPNSVTAIEREAFYQCTALEEVTIPEGAILEDSIFTGCINLRSVTIGASVFAIPANTFYNCSGLTCITIPHSVTSIGYAAFRGCSSLAHVYYGGSEADWNAIKIEKYNDALKSAETHYGITMPEQAEAVTETITKSFSDVPADAYYADSVRWAVERGITNGTGATTFSPDQTCTTAQILTFLWRAYGSPEAAVSNTFTNMAANAYYRQAARWAKGLNMVEGPVFSPNTPCTRASTVMYLWQAAGCPVVTTQTSFTDVSADEDYAMAVAWALEMGITNGTSATTFTPNATCTRGQIATFLYRGLA